MGAQHDRIILFALMLGMCGMVAAVANQPRTIQVTVVSRGQLNISIARSSAYEDTETIVSGLRIAGWEVKRIERLRDDSIQMNLIHSDTTSNKTQPWNLQLPVEILKQMVDHSGGDSTVVVVVPNFLSLSDGDHLPSFTTSNEQSSFTRYTLPISSIPLHGVQVTLRERTDLLHWFRVAVVWAIEEGVGPVAQAETGPDGSFRLEGIASKGSGWFSLRTARVPFLTPLLLSPGMTILQTLWLRK